MPGLTSKTLTSLFRNKNYAEILEYLLFQLQRSTINFTKQNKIEEDNTRNELVSELDLALNEQAEGTDNHELILELQSRVLFSPQGYGDSLQEMAESYRKY